ncbi:MAG: hypothetical protein A2Z29_00745 [Chloroflexi bacterium RBG_16_56_11]|nr:MAG: hypothetical protein A2Z29_00745 [Chloroflexi bacterium RBG_16_56_11]
MKDWILNTILDKEAGSLEAMAMGLAGVNIITGHTAARINSNLPGEVSGVTLDDGRLIHCEMVVVAIGVRPRLDTVVESGLKVNRGITVDRHMAASAPDVYACGDVAEAYDFIIGGNRLTPVWPNAYNGGRVAGLNMAGQTAEYEGGTAMNSLKYFGLHIVSAGLVAPPNDSYETITKKIDSAYRKVILRNGRLAGLVFTGDIEKSGIVYNLMKDGADVSNFKKALVADDFGLAYLPKNLRQARLLMPEEAAGPGVTGLEEPEVLPVGD